MAVYRFATLNVLRALNIGFKNSFDIELAEFSEPELTAIAINMALGVSKLSTSDYTVTGVTVSDMYYNAMERVWVQGGTYLQIATDNVGTRTALPITRTPYGFGVLVTQLGVSPTGRKGKLILKTGFWEQMIQATMTRWQFEGGSAGYTEWLTRWSGVMALETGEFGQYMSAGANEAKLVNLHKGNSAPSVNTSWVARTLNRYRLPRAMVD